MLRIVARTTAETMHFCGFLFRESGRRYSMLSDVETKADAIAALRNDAIPLLQSLATIMRECNAEYELEATKELLLEMQNRTAEAVTKIDALLELKRSFISHDSE